MNSFGENEKNLAWYLIYTKSRQERVAEENLVRQGYTVYLPFVERRLRRRGSYQWVTEPLFPRYLFIHLDSEKDNWGPIRSTRGVAKLVRFGNANPAVVPDKLITYIKQREEEKSFVEDERLKPGQPVRIVEGVMAGYEGIFEAKSGSKRVILLLDIVGGPTRVELSIDSVSS